MIIVLNGPIGIGKSTLAESLAESIDRCVMLDGDKLVAVNPAPPNELENLHEVITLLVDHYQRLDYVHFVINHCWRSPAELADLHRRVAGSTGEVALRCFLLTLPVDENLRRLERRERARAISEREFELRTLAEEREAFGERSDLGEPFDVSAPPSGLVTTMLDRLGLPQARS